jgi:hypothetical protein
MTPSEWTAVVGVLFTAGGLIWGHGLGAGKAKKQIEDMSGSLKACSTELATIKANFQNCQLKSAQNTTEAHTAIGAVRTDLTQLQATVNDHFTEFIDHMGRRDVHTDAEWRATILGSLDSMTTSFDSRMSTFQEALLNRIGSLEKAVKNGNASK